MTLLSRFGLCSQKATELIFFIVIHPYVNYMNVILIVIMLFMLSTGTDGAEYLLKRAHSNPQPLQRTPGMESAYLHIIRTYICIPELISQQENTPN